MKSYRDRCGTSLASLLKDAKPMAPGSNRRVKTRLLSRWQVLVQVRNGCPHCHASLKTRMGKKMDPKKDQGMYWVCNSQACPVRDPMLKEYYYIGFNGERVFE